MTMMKRMTCSAALMLMAFAAPAFAQYRGLTSYGQRAAYDRGYQDGAKEGQKDLRDRRTFEFERDGKYRDGDSGYKREFGDRDSYRRVYRDGYATGYTDAFDRRNGNGYPPYGRGRGRAVPRQWPGDQDPQYPNRYPGRTYPNGRYGDYGTIGSDAYRLAADNGYRDGLEKGREDSRKNRSSDPVRHDWYRSGDRGFNNDRLISRDQYRDAYREGFRQGYAQGYRQSYDN